MNPVILFRYDLDTEDEMAIAEQHFPICNLRSTIPQNSLVIPRYSALPYFRELENDVNNLGSKLINRWDQFRFITNFEYYELIGNFTFKTYFSPMELPDTGPVIVKGMTNSRKHQWDTHCFARTKREAIEIAYELENDSLIGQQQIIFREYHKLKTFETLIHGLPVTNEFRFFCYKNRVIDYGYYWSCALHPELGKLDQDAFDLVYTVSNLIASRCNFYTIDIAQDENDKWWVVELNSGEMSGLSMIKPTTLYARMKEIIV